MSTNLTGSFPNRNKFFRKLGTYLCSWGYKRIAYDFDEKKKGNT
jgi:hypothetical protein